jgi:RNA polymerase sigma-70 factor (ECF subfamily)
LAVTEEALITQCRKGSTAAFEQLVERYEKRVYNLAYRLTGNREDASDIAQEAFLKVYTSLNDFRGESSFSTWLYRVVSNACLDELRKRSRRKVVSFDNPYPGEDDSPRQLPSDDPEPSADMERIEEKEAVQRGINELSDDHRMIIIMRDIQDMSYEDIASVLGLSIGTVKSRLNRARLSLRDHLSSMELFSDRGVRTGERGDDR